MNVLSACPPIAVGIDGTGDLAWQTWHKIAGIKIFHISIDMPAGTIGHINATVGIDIAFFTLMAKLINFELLWRACNIKFKRACGYVWRIEATIKFGGDIR